MMDRPRYAFVGDDFTGATDTLATLTRAGLRARLFLQVPDRAGVSGLDAFGVATEARGLGNDALRDLADGIGAALADHAPDVVHYKICSTFDSAPSTGNFMVAVETLHRHLGFRTAMVLGGQPSLGRYCVFGTLFARGPDGQVHRIDRHPVMAQHPVTPMHEADLRRHIAALHRETGQQLAVPDLLDAMTQEDIRDAGARIRAAAGPVLCIGASSVAEAIFDVPAAHGCDAGDTVANLACNGPVLGFAGSRSAQSAAQVGAATQYHKIAVAADPAGDPLALQQAVDLLSRGRNVLLHLAPGCDGGHSPRDLAQASARLVAAISDQSPVGALAVAGGDTSSAIVRALQPHSLSARGDLGPGVAVCLAHFRDGPEMPMVLKGGQMGAPDHFDRVVRLLGRE